KHLCGPTRYAGARSSLYHNDGNGTFSDVTRKAGLAEDANTALGVVVWDYDDDGWPDLVVARDMQANLLLRNNHDGTFTDRAGEAGVAFSSQGKSRAGMGIDTADTTNSGRESILIGNNSDQGIAQLLAGGQGQFADIADQSGLYQPSLKLATFGL